MKNVVILLILVVIVVIVVILEWRRKRLNEFIWVVSLVLLVALVLWLNLTGPDLSHEWWTPTPTALSWWPFWGHPIPTATP